MTDSPPYQTDAKLQKQTRRTAATERKRELIIEAAERIFAQNGFHQTTVAAIAAVSGVREALARMMLSKRKATLEKVEQMIFLLLRAIRA